MPPWCATGPDARSAVPRRSRRSSAATSQTTFVGVAVREGHHKLRTRLETLRDEKVQDDAEFTEALIEAEELEDDLLDEMLAEPDEAEAASAPRAIDRQKLREEIDILQRLADWARSIGTDTKTKTLLTALNIGFAQMATTGAARKALIFTESRRTQDYLKAFLESHGYGGQVVLFNGTNGGPEATAIYERWVEKNRDTGRASGSRAVDVRTALIEHFRDEASILLATEAAAEGIPDRIAGTAVVPAHRGRRAFHHPLGGDVSSRIRPTVRQGRVPIGRAKPCNEPTRPTPLP